MRAIIIMIALLMASSAWAGADTWTKGNSNVSTLTPGNYAEITPSTAPSTTPILKLDCDNVRFYRQIDASPMTFDILECDSSEANCDAINATTIGATNNGYAEPIPPDRIALSILTNAGDTVRVTCNGD